MTALATEQTLADLAIHHPGASRVFHGYRLDFCCQGRRSLAAACAERSLDPEALLAEIREQDAVAGPGERWDERPIEELIQFIVRHYHERLRQELPQLIGLAEKVEAVHADKASVPAGLARHLEDVHEAVLAHLGKEEQVLFPALLSGRGRGLAPVVRVLESEHGDHRVALERIRHLTDDLRLPAEACTTWRALYLRLQQLEADLMEHIHLENHVLFGRALGE